MTATPKNETKTDLSEWIEDQLADRLMTVAEFATVVGVSATSVRSWMAGREVPSRLNRAKLAKAAGVDRRFVDRLVAGK